MLVLVLTAAPLYSEENNTPIQIEADNMQYFGDKQMSVFKGKVVVIREDMKMTADEMQVFFTKNREVKEILSRGNVRIEKEGLLALSGRAKLFQKEQKVELSENARVWQGDNYLEGEKVTLYTGTDRLFVEKGDEKRVKIILAPQKEK
jgi:lipopolysaccharide export system protein LptA